MPKRVQRKRARGWRMPDDAIYVGRPSKWGSPFIPNFHTGGTREECVEKYRQALLAGELRVSAEDVRRELVGFDLMCWCPIYHDGGYTPCHADVLIAVANDLTEEEVVRENTRWAKGQALL